MDAKTIKKETPTGIAASGESRAIGENATETTFVSVYDAALMGVALMAGPITPRCNCTWKCKLYPWCDLEKHLGHRLALGLLEVGQVGPVLLPVVRAQFLPSHLAVKMAFKGKTVVRWKWAKIVRPGPYVAAVLIAENAGHFCVTTGHVQDPEICGYLFHEAQSNLDRPVSQIRIDPFTRQCLP